MNITRFLILVQNKLSTTHSESDDRYILASTLCHNKHTLDVGCKYGAGVPWIGKYAKSLVLTDLEDQRWPEILHYRFIETDFTKDEAFDDSEFECVVMLEILEHVKKPEKLINHVYRILEKGGTFIFSTPCVERDIETHIKPFFTKEEVLGLIDPAKFKINFLIKHLDVSWFGMMEKK